MDGDSMEIRNEYELDDKSQLDVGYNVVILGCCNEDLLDGYNECQELACRSLEFLELGCNEDHEEYL